MTWREYVPKGGETKMGRLLTRKSRIGVAGLLALTLLAGPGVSSPAWAQLASLKTIPVPCPYFSVPM